MEHCRGYGPRPRNRNADQTHHQHHPPHGAPDTSPLYPGVLATTHMEKNWEPPPYA